MQGEVGPTSVTIHGGSRHTPMKRTTFGCLMALMMLTCISSTAPDVLCLCAVCSSSFDMVEAQTARSVWLPSRGGHSNITSRDNCLKADMILPAADVLVH